MIKVLREHQHPCKRTWGQFPAPTSSDLKLQLQFQGIYHPPLTSMSMHINSDSQTHNESLNKKKCKEFILDHPLPARPSQVILVLWQESLFLFVLELLPTQCPVSPASQVQLCMPRNIVSISNLTQANLLYPNPPSWKWQRQLYKVTTLRVVMSKSMNA